MSAAGLTGKHRLCRVEEWSGRPAGKNTLTDDRCRNGHEFERRGKVKQEKLAPPVREILQPLSEKSAKATMSIGALI